MGILTDARKATRLVKKALKQRAARARVTRLLADQGALPEGRFKVAVYFADGAVNMYQMRQWYAPLEQLAQRWPVVVLSRAVTGAEALLNDGRLPVAFVPQVSDLEEFVAAQDIRVVLYVNQNTRNFQMFRYGRRWHVFINHGESDKMYMTTNQYKAYDYAMIAGQAARERLGRVLWNYDLEQRALEIGRPQADHYSGSVPFPAEDRTVILYAPTWEGDRPAAHYGSVVSHGEALAAAVLASPKHRLVYRPHPRSGVVDPAYGAANDRIIAAIAAANAADSDARHVFDDAPELGWQLAVAHVAVVDISAMVYDRLAAGKPLLITRPVDPEASVDTSGYLDDCEWLPAERAADVLAEADRVRSDPAAAARLGMWVQHYFGDTTPGAATARFHDAVEQLMDRWEQAHLEAIGDAPEKPETDPEEVPEEDD